jgi:Raf kinase inhibitor-like YbhB/YbcL family protein
MGKGSHGDDPKFTRLQTEWSDSSKYTCEAEDVSPPLEWEGVPDGAKSLVLIIDDPDAPDPKAPKMVWVHWVVYNIPPNTESLPENAGKTRLPQGALLGLNDFKKTEYGARVHRSAGTVTSISSTRWISRSM